MAAGCAPPAPAPPSVTLGCGLLEPNLLVWCGEEDVTFTESVPLDGTLHTLACEDAAATVLGTCTLGDGTASLAIEATALHPPAKPAYAQPRASLEAVLGPGRYRVSVEGTEAGAPGCTATVGDLPTDPLAVGTANVFDQALDGDRAVTVQVDCGGDGPPWPGVGVHWVRAVRLDVVVQPEGP